MSGNQINDEVIPLVVTSFRDFELEERVVRIMAYRGFRIGDRKIAGIVKLAAEEILLTDMEFELDDAACINLPTEARNWNEEQLQTFLRHQISPPVSPDLKWPDVLIVAESQRALFAEELVRSINGMGLLAVIAPFEERDLRMALVPTRRYEERVRHSRFAHAETVLFLLGTDRREVAMARSMIEYYRRIHPHLNLGFILLGGRKAERSEVKSHLEPFSIFYLRDDRDEVLRLWPSRNDKSDRKFLEIKEWIGSLHGNPGQSGNCKNGAPARGTRAFGRIGRSVAASR